MDSKQFEEFMKIQKRLLDYLCKKTPETTCAAPTLVSNFEPFNEMLETFHNYLERFENYCVLKQINGNKQYCARLLMNSIGAKHYETIVAISAPRHVQDIAYDELLNILSLYFAPKRNVLVVQHEFLSTYQKEEESIAEYCASLRRNINACQFISPCDCRNDISDIFLRAQFIRGIKDNHIREELLQAEETDFKKIVEKSVSLEASKRDCQLLANNNNYDNSTVTINKLDSHANRARSSFRHRQDEHRSMSQNRLRRTKSQGRSQKIDYHALGIDGLCLRCGRNNHTARDCKSNRKNLKCSGCKKSGHIAKVCIKTLLTSQSSSTYQITDEDYTAGVNIISNVNQNSSDERYYATVLINNIPVNFEVDSGSGYTFLPRNYYHKLNLHSKLEPVNIIFRSYTADAFTPDGKVSVNVKFQNESITEDIYIVPENYSPLLGRIWIRKLKIKLQDLDVDNSNPNLFPRSIQQVNSQDEILKEYSDLFQDTVGCLSNFQVSLQLRENAKPAFLREREVPYALREAVERELDSLEASGIISKTDTSDWGSPLVVIQKKNGGVRLCVDYKVHVNKQLQGAHYPIRKIEDILNSLKDSKWFCTLDLYKAYLHVPVDKPSSIIQTISTHRGTYHMNRLSFGIKTAPSEFNRIIDQILQGLPKTVSYFDDIIVHGATAEECKWNLRKCFERLRLHNLHLNRQKCSFFQQRIQFLGHVVEFNKILKSKEKVKAVTEMPRPKSCDGVRTFLGMVTYYSRFIPDLSTLSAPLRSLLKKDKTFRWTAQCEAAFIKLKNEICSDRVLMPYNPDLPVQLACDASPDGISGVLSHILDNGTERPIAFTSRALTEAEANYSQLDREALAIIYSVQHFYLYLIGRRFTLITDNQPLERIFHQHSKIPKMTSARLQRYAAYLSGFDYQVHSKRGKDNSNADCLSRAPVNLPSNTPDVAINNEVNQLCSDSIFAISSNTLTFKTILIETDKDPVLSIIKRKLLETNEHQEYTLDSGILFKGPRVVVPASLQKSMLAELHRTHVGITKMKQLARKYVYWKNIDQDIDKCVRLCKNCQMNQNNPPKVTLHPWDEPKENWQRIHIDYAGPFQGYFFLIVVDAKSKWLEIPFSKNPPTTMSTIEELKEIFSRYGYPEVMVSDNATIFTSETFKTFCQHAGIFQKFIAPSHPATNGLAERHVQTLKKRLTAMISENKSMKEKVREILFRYRGTPLQNGETPCERFLHRQIRLKFDAMKPTNFLKNKEALNSVRQLKVGDAVLSRFYTARKECWKNGVITKKFGRLHYLVKLYNGHTLKRHIDQLRLQVEEECSSAPPSEEVFEFSRPHVQRENEGNAQEEVGTPQNQREDNDEGVRQRSVRNRRPPAYIADYVQ